MLLTCRADSSDFEENVTEQHCVPDYDAPTSLSPEKVEGMVYNRRAHNEPNNFNSAAEQFLRAFTPVFNRTRDDPGSEQYLLANMLMIRYLIARINLSRSPSESELSTDVFLRDFMLAVSLSREIISHAKTTVHKTLFDFDVGLGTSVFVLARVCREPRVRREAIQLLSELGVRRGGWFDKRSATGIARWLMEREEDGMNGCFVPDEARLRLIRHEVVGKRMARVMCSKFVWREGKATREMMEPVLITL